MKINRGNYIGYNFASPIQGSVIPQRLQNLCIRDYAAVHGLNLSFSSSEYWDYSKALMLMGLLHQLNVLDGIIFYSFALLPMDKKRRNHFLETILADGKQIHFALENLHFSKIEDLGELEYFYLLCNHCQSNKSNEVLYQFI